MVGSQADTKLVYCKDVSMLEFQSCSIGFPGSTVVKNLPTNAGDLRDTGLIPGLGRGNGNPLQYSCLENPMVRGNWWPTVHGVAESDTTQ